LHNGWNIDDGNWVRSFFVGKNAMTRDDIIRMAKKAGWKRVGRNPETGPEFPVLVNRLERFAALVAAAEREACAEVCEKLPETFRIVADEFGYKAELPTAENYAAAIRARGK
jgi:hypothetical protein